jgi:FAD-binding domain/Ferric reductase like transmembrane component
VRIKKTNHSIDDSENRPTQVGDTSRENVGVTPDVGAVLPAGDDNEEPSLHPTSVTKSQSATKQHRSRSMDFTPPWRQSNVSSHRSRSMDFVRNGQTNKRQAMSNMFCLDSERGIVLNLHLGNQSDERTSPVLQRKMSNVPKPTIEVESDGCLDVGDRAPLCSTSDHSNSWTRQRNDPYVHLARKISTTSCASALTFHDEELPTQLTSFHSVETYQTRSKSSLVMWPDEKSYPNDPHPALEYPPLYFLIRQSPFVLELAKDFFRFRWRISYPLQQRIPFSRTFFRKMNLFITVGELLLVLPFVATLILCTIYSFIYPSVAISGHAARIPLIFAFVTAMKNSLLTLLLGIPFERAIWYHKLSAKLAYVNGIMHTLVAFFHPDSIGTDLPPPSSFVGSASNFGQFLFSDEVNTGGTMLMVFMTLMMITALPFVRRRVFEVFYYLHISFVISMIVCAFFHTGTLLPSLAALTWGIDLMIRKVYMACFRYERKASVRIVSDTVVELCFPKSNGFDYNPGQYIYLAIPAISIFEWHPFSLSSSPGQKIVTLHIRRAGGWTSALHDLAKKQMEVSILMEGPYGSVGVDLASCCSAVESE